MIHRECGVLKTTYEADMALYFGRYRTAVTTLVPAVATDIKLKNTTQAAQKSVKVSKSRTVPVTVRGNNREEPTEWFRAVIVRINRDAVEAASPGRVIVVNDDEPAP